MANTNKPNYRDDLAHKINEIRKSNPEKAKGYLEAKQETGEYKKAEKKYRGKVKKLLTKKEKTHIVENNSSKIVSNIEFKTPILEFDELTKRLKLKEQYNQCLITLKSYGFLEEDGNPKEGDVKVPTYEEAIGTLTLQELEVATHFSKPMLLIIPECSFKHKVEAFNEHAFKISVDHEIYANDIGSKKITGYRVSIADKNYNKSMDMEENGDGYLSIEERMENVKKERMSGEKGMDRNKYILLLMESVRANTIIDGSSYTIFDDDYYLSTNYKPCGWVKGIFSQGYSYGWKEFIEYGEGYWPGCCGEFRSSVGGDIIIS